MWYRVAEKWSAKPKPKQWLNQGWSHRPPEATELDHKKGHITCVADQGPCHVCSPFRPVGLQPVTKMHLANALGAMTYSYRRLLQPAQDVDGWTALWSSFGPTAKRSSHKHASVCRMLSEHTCLCKLWVCHRPFIQRQPCRKPPAHHRASARWWRRCANVRRQTRRQVRKPWRSFPKNFERSCLRNSHKNPVASNKQEPAKWPKPRKRSGRGCYNIDNDCANQWMRKRRRRNIKNAWPKTVGVCRKSFSQSGQRKWSIQAVVGPTPSRDLADNDTGLPRAGISPEATMLEDWCKTGSWNICSTCYSLEPRHLKEVDTRRVAAPSITPCRWCSKDGAASVPTVQDVPKKLRGLTEKIVAALRPFDIDLGPYKRPLHGYREHTAMVRLLWAEQSVPEKIAALPRKPKKKAEKAYRHLLQSNVSEYKTFVSNHNKFLKRHPEGASQAERRRPLQQIEAPGVECALWPDLYFNSNLCETVERATDARRLERQGVSTSIWDNEEDDEEGQTRGSIRRSFLKKVLVLGPILDYSGSFELLQFVHDLAYWSELGVKRHVQPHLPMRVLMKGAPFTPAYWAVRHAAVLDLQRQCGHPVMFKTWAPYEWSAPYHRALLHQMESLLRTRTHLATLETVHLAHILVELLREWYVGGAKKQGESSVAWQHNVLAGFPEDGDGRPCCKNYAVRLEYQDGKRKAASQDYHGRGAIHLHAVIFAEDLACLNLHKKLLATEPPEDHPLRGYILDQLSFSGSGWPVFEEPSKWNPSKEAVQLEHSERDHEQGVRAYGLEEVDVLKCHVDNLAPQARPESQKGLILRYVATYGVKPSSEFHNELLGDTNLSGYGLALRVLMCLHPSEPEMVMSLFKQLFPDFVMGGTMKPIVAPWPTMEPLPKFVQLYQVCAWRGDNMTLLEFLRKSNDAGDVIDWLRKAHEAKDPASDLGEFATEYRTFGEKVIAAEMVSPFNDKYFGQWLMLYKPFRNILDLLDPEVMEKVPPRYRNFGNAWQKAPSHWNSPAKIREELELEARQDCLHRQRPGPHRSPESHCGAIPQWKAFPCGRGAGARQHDSADRRRRQPRTPTFQSRASFGGVLCLGTAGYGGSTIHGWEQTRRVWSSRPQAGGVESTVADSWRSRDWQNICGWLPHKPSCAKRLQDLLCLADGRLGLQDAPEACGHLHRHLPRCLSLLPAFVGSHCPDDWIWHGGHRPSGAAWRRRIWSHYCHVQCSEQEAFSPSHGRWMAIAQHCARL